MEESFTAESGVDTPGVAQAQTRFKVLGAISFSHFLNDMMQSLIVAIYPLLKGEFHLSFVEIGAITLTYQVCASVLQPVIGVYTDKHPKPYSLSVGMGFTLIGMVILAFAPNYASVLAAAAVICTRPPLALSLPELLTSDLSVSPVCTSFTAAAIWSLTASVISRSP